MELIQEMLELAGETIPALKLCAVFDPAGENLWIFQNSQLGAIDDIADRATATLPDTFLAADKTSFIINYGNKNSLVENVNVSAGIDPAFASIFRMPNSGGGVQSSYYSILKNSVELQNEFKLLLKSDAAKNSRQTNFLPSNLKLPFEGPDPENIDFNNVDVSLNKLFNDFSLENNSGYLPVINSFLSSYINSSFAAGFREKLLASYLRDNKTVAQSLLSSYLLNADVTIHGTVGLGGMDHAIIKDYIPSIGGMYVMNTIEDIITPSNFQTVINMALIKQLDILNQTGNNT